MAIVFNPSGFSRSATVSPISKPSRPTIAQISPASTSSIFLLPKPSKVWSSLILVFLMLPSRLTKDTDIPSFKIPLCNLPIAIRPVKDEKSKEVINIWVVPSSITGDLICSKTISNNGSILSVSFLQSSLIQLFLAEP